MNTLYNLQALKSVIENRPITVVYFSSETCNVCKTLKPKIREMLAMQFPEAELVYVDVEKSPVIAGQYRVFTLPTIDIYVEGKEHARFSRNVALYEFESAIRKPYDLLFTE
ncbi:MAG: thioredoxin family protein [Bacteroidales bacterium]